MSPTKKEPDSLTLAYQLLDLPTAQHKAGLAGLLLMIETMNRRKMANVPRVVSVTNSEAQIEFSEESLQAVFDDLYEATSLEAEYKKKLKGRQPKRLVQKVVPTKNGATKKEKIYVYEVLRPKGAFLETLFPDGDGIWLKLWRDMLWQTLRGIPKTRGVYEQRLRGDLSALVGNMWKTLVRSQKLRAQGKLSTESISSSLFIGAQDVNAERVPFKGTPEENLLLHFWTIVSLVFVPNLVKRDGESQFAGYVLAIPEPADLTYFLEEVSELLGSLDTAAAGYIPRAALIDVPAEGGLEYLYHLARYRVESQALAFSLSCVELHRLEKRGNNIRTLTSERVMADASILSTYKSLRQTCRNPLFKSQRIMNLLAGELWFAKLEEAFSNFPYGFFIWKAGETPKRMPFFGIDANRTFTALEIDLNHLGGSHAMSKGDEENELAVGIYKLIRSYANQRAESKSGKKYSDFKNSKDDEGRVQYPADYLEARQKICAEAFLAMRSRRSTDFIEYFSGTICSVPQYLPQDEYLIISRALATDWQTVKTLSMLALSAQSFMG